MLAAAALTEYTLPSLVGRLVQQLGGGLAVAPVTVGHALCGPYAVVCG